MSETTTPYRPVEHVDEDDIGKESLDCLSMEEAGRQSLDSSEFAMQPQLRSSPQEELGSARYHLRPSIAC